MRTRTLALHVGMRYGGLGTQQEAQAKKHRDRPRLCDHSGLESLNRFAVSKGFGIFLGALELATPVRRRSFEAVWKGWHPFPSSTEIESLKKVVHAVNIYPSRVLIHLIL